MSAVHVFLRNSLGHRHCADLGVEFLPFSLSQCGRKISEQEIMEIEESLRQNTGRAKEKVNSLPGWEPETDSPRDKHE